MKAYPASSPTSQTLMLKGIQIFLVDVTALEVLLQQVPISYPQLKALTGCSAALWEAERCFAELWSKVLFPFFSSAQIPGAVEGQDLFERHHVAFAEGQQHFLGHSVPLLSDHMHFLLCVSCLGSSNDTQALDTRRGWCFIFPPCSSAILLFVFFLIRVRVN